jgi:hypothetical protein
MKPEVGYCRFVHTLNSLLFSLSYCVELGGHQRQEGSH